MIKKSRFLLTLLGITLTSTFLLTACNSDNNRATELQFVEQEPGVPAYKTRMIINHAFIRVDDGPDSKDFILFDRKAKKISSVSHEDQRIFEIDSHPNTLKPPADLNWQHQTMDAKDAPTIQGIKPTGHSFKANQQTCLQTMAAKGLLEEARQALIEYQTVLAGEHAANLHKTPKAEQQPCDNALMIYYPTDSLKYGFPIIEWDASGHRRQLESFTENITVEKDLFTLPEGFEVFSINK